jgi:hypothetical protein
MQQLLLYSGGNGAGTDLSVMTLVTGVRGADGRYRRVAGKYCFAVRRRAVAW